MSRRTTFIVAALSMLALGSPLNTGCTKNSLAIQYFEQGVEKHREKSYQEAIDAYTKAIEISPLNEDAYYNRGHAQHMLYNFQEAIDDYTRVIDIEPKHIRAYRMRGVAKAGFGDSQGAMADYTMAIEIAP